MIADMTPGRRRHPAKRARQVTGAVAAGGAIALFGYFGITTDANASSTGTARSTVDTGTGGLTSGSTSRGTQPSRRSQNLPATPSTTPRPIPNTHPYSTSGGS